jgi:hypothetical protein
MERGAAIYSENSKIRPARLVIETLIQSCNLLHPAQALGVLQRQNVLV